MRGAEGLKLELFYDSTVEPFGTLRFDFGVVRSLLRTLAKSGVEVRIIDTAGWNRRMLSEAFSRASAAGKEFRGIFGSGRRKGWFFGREVPAVLLIKEGRVIDVYPHVEEGGIRTVEEGLRCLIRRLGVRE